MKLYHIRLLDLFHLSHKIHPQTMLNQEHQGPPQHLLLFFQHFLFRTILLIHLFQLLSALPSYTSSSITSPFSTSSSFISSLSTFLFTLFNFLLLYHLFLNLLIHLFLFQLPFPPSPLPPSPPSFSTFSSTPYNFLLLFPPITIFSFSSAFLNG